MEGTILDYANFSIDRATKDAVSWGQWNFVSNDRSYARSGYYTNKIVYIWIPYEYNWQGTFVAHGSGVYDGRLIQVDFSVYAFVGGGNLVLLANGEILNPHG